ncbi:MAG TPA: hypothetical protein VMW38_05590 [Terriglobia bacterium]|nr:hypothetical protein [Terriglobia bacterium]
MASLDHFGPGELNVIRTQLSDAESLVSHYYCIPGREWPMYPYEIKTLSELGETEIDLNALAMVAKYEYALKKTRGQPRYQEVYGICLQDHNILAATRRACNPVTLDALMLYILTHELVHVFRFASSLQPYLIEEEFREQEESRVHRITNHILRERQENSLQQVLDVFEDYPFGALER